MIKYRLVKYTTNKYLSTKVTLNLLKSYDDLIKSNIENKKSIIVPLAKARDRSKNQKTINSKKKLI